MPLAFGVLAALLEARRSGVGQVVDAAMVDGVAALMTMTYAYYAKGTWKAGRNINMLDGGAPFYNTFETADGEYVAVGAIEPQFYAQLVEGLGLSDVDLPAQDDRRHWPELKAIFADVFRARTRAHWKEVFAGTDACVTPVLSPWEALLDDHIAQRGTVITVDGLQQPAPAPRFSRTHSNVSGSPPSSVDAVESSLKNWGIESERIDSLRRQGVISCET
jgi:alpha-methylacyl-CoA racemase